MTTDALPVASRASLRGRHLLGIQGLTKDEIVLILDTADAMKEIASRSIKKVPTLRGRTVVNLFFEPSTRTRTSFEVAEKRLSADTLSIATAVSSVVKGETLVDTVLNLEAMSPDIIVMRHSSSGAAHLVARIGRSHVVNAGDGLHEHPTQALLDAFTIREHKGEIAGLKVAIVGDLFHSRVFRSNAILLNTLGAEVHVCAPATLLPPAVERFGVKATTRIEEAVEGADVVMMLRIQQERMHGHFFPNTREYFEEFGLTPERAKLAKADAIIMHPGLAGSMDTNSTSQRTRRQTSTTTAPPATAPASTNWMGSRSFKRASSATAPDERRRRVMDPRKRQHPDLPKTPFLARKWFRWAQLNEPTKSHRIKTGAERLVKWLASQKASPPQPPSGQK